jgi:single-stranded DNA-specific DHH superfamily exonuclease
VNFLAYLSDRKKKTDESGFLKQLKFVASKFIEISKTIKYFLVITHSDADGYACGSILQRMAERERISTSVVIIIDDLMETYYLIVSISTKKDEPI